GSAERAQRELFEPNAMDPDLPELAGQRICVVVDLMVARGDLDAARSDVVSLIERWQALHNTSGEGFGHYALARVLLACGDYEAAAREAMVAQELLLLPLHQFWALAVLSAARYSQGRAAEACDAARQAVL